MLPQPPRATPFPYTTLFRSNQQQALEPLEDDAESAGANPEELLLERVDSDRLRRALDELPREYREVIVLRELEELSYKEIAGIAGIPIGTVMSRLARARRRLQQAVAQGGIG